MNKIILLIVLVLLSVSNTYLKAIAEQPQKTTSLSLEEVSQLSFEEKIAHFELRRQQEDARRAQTDQVQMNRSEETNPEAYNQMLEQRAKQGEIRLVIEAHARGELPSAEARYQLAEWMHDDVMVQLENVDDELERLRQRVAKLEQQKNNPDDYLMQRVDEMLGLAQPEQEEFLPPF